MTEFICPGCRGAIEADLIERTGAAECRYCGHDLSSLGLPEPVSTSGASERDEDSSAVVSETIEGPLPAVPEGSKVRVIEATADRLMVFLPGGGKAAGALGLFAILWNGFLCFFTPTMLFGMWKAPGNKAEVFYLIPFLGLFWAVGLAFIWFWLRMRFEKTFVSIDRDRIVLKRRLFNRTRTREVALGPNSRAELVEAYQQNDTPVYRIEVSGTAGAAKFGTGLSDAEKEWLVDRINEFLRGAISPEAQPETGFPDACRSCGAPLGGAPADGVLACAFCNATHRGVRPPVAAALPTDSYERLNPGDLPVGSGIEVLDDSPNRLQFEFSMTTASPWRFVVPLVSIPVVMVWLAGVAMFLGAIQAPFGLPRMLPLAALVPLGVLALIFVGATAFLFCGRTTIELTRETLECRWSVGGLGHSRKLPTSRIESIRVESFETMGRNPRLRTVRRERERRGSGTGPAKSCVVRAPGRLLFLTLARNERFSRQVAALLRTRLADMGHALPND